jgi:hypothetical protein
LSKTKHGSVCLSNLTGIKISSIHVIIERDCDISHLKIGLLNIRSLTSKAIIVNELITDHNQSKLDALNLTGMINEPTRYNPKSVDMGTLIDIILTNLPSKYTINQDLSNHCLIACVLNGSAVKRPPLIIVKRSLKHFSEQAFLITWTGYPGRILTSSRQ